MARSVDFDPYMNFRFGVRLNENSPWLGFSEVSISPDKIGAASGTVQFKKALGAEFIDFVGSVTDRVNIGIFHRTEALSCPNPRMQIDLYGVACKSLAMGSIKLDAKGGDAEMQVLTTDVTMSYERMEMRHASTKLKARRRGVRPVKPDHTIYM